MVVELDAGLFLMYRESQNPELYKYEFASIMLEPWLVPDFTTVAWKRAEPERYRPTWETKSASVTVAPEGRALAISKRYQVYL